MDDEIKGEGNSVNFEYRMHDPRLGRFLRLDPLSSHYPSNAPYAKAGGITDYSSAAAADQLQYLKTHGEVSNNYLDAQVGNFIFWDRGGDKCHTGVVTKVETVNNQARIYVLRAQGNNGNAPTVKKELQLLTTKGKEGLLAGFNQPFVAVGRMKSKKN